jgi:glycerophosphoryl diester phosphodiesterase
MTAPASSLLSLTTVSAIAHRGGSKLRPENTLAAFTHAASLGVDAIECDVHLTRDDEVVVIHDFTLDRTTNGTGAVAAKTARELAALDAGYWFRAAGRYPYRGQGIGVPALGELLAQHPALPVVVEIKGEDERTARRTLEVIDRAGARGRVVLGAFSHRVLTYIRRQAPDLPTGASSIEARAAVRRAFFGLGQRNDAFNVFHVPFVWHGRRRFGPRFVRAAKRSGRPVQAWVVDDEAQMRLLLRWGVTGIISDRPDVAVAVTRDQLTTSNQQPTTKEQQTTNNEYRRQGYD